MTSHFPSDWNVETNLANWLLESFKYLLKNSWLAVFNPFLFGYVQVAVEVVLLFAALLCCPRRIEARHLQLVIFPLLLLVATSMWDAYCLPARKSNSEHFVWQATVFYSLLGLFAAPYGLVYLYTLCSETWAGERKFATFVVLNFTVMTYLLAFWHEMLLANIWL